MLEVLQFIFSSFWIWAGTMFLLAYLIPVIQAIVSLIKVPKDEEDARH